MSVAETDYLAISHVWGDAEWQILPMIDGNVLVSKEKAKFIEERLASIVGAAWFWMDILCVDQRDKEARIAVTQHIPTIFRHAKQTVVISESTGFQQCCADASGVPTGELPTDYLTDKCQYLKRLLDHYNAVHDPDDFLDGILSRLWPFQEIMLSDNVQFVRCEQIGPRPNKTWTMGIAIGNHIVSLRSLCTAWVSYGNSTGINFNFSTGVVQRLLFAYIQSSDASRTPASKTSPTFPAYDGFMMQINSTRRATKSRDFILATMPQYSFYTVPPNAKTMSFAQLFVDCYQQLEAKQEDLELVPNVHGQLDIAQGIVRVTDNIHVVPEATVLGDVVKLFYGPKLQKWKRSRGDVPVGPFWGRKVVVNQATDISQSDTIYYIGESIHRSAVLWAAATHGDLPESCTGPNQPPDGVLEPTDLRAVAEGLYALSLSGGDREYISSIEDYAFRSANPESILRLAALIVCGYGVNAFEWSQRSLKPVLVKFRGKTFLGLVPHSTLEGEYKFYLVKADRSWAYLKWKPFALVAWKQKEEADSYILCPFSQDENWIGRKFWRRWI